MIGVLSLHSAHELQQILCAFGSPVGLKCDDMKKKKENLRNRQGAGTVGLSALGSRRQRTTPAHAARFGQVDSLERTAPSHRTPAFPRQCPTPDRDSRPPRAASPRRLVRRAAYYVRTITSSFCSRYDRQFPVPRSPARGRAIYPRDRIPSSSHPPRRRGWKRRRWGWRARAAAHIGADRTPRWTRSGAERGRPAPCRVCQCAASAPHGIQSVSVR